MEHVQTVQTIKQVALDYLKQGFSIVPTKADKKPTISWKKYQNEKPRPEDVQNWNIQKIALVGGKVSKKLECIDIDTKNDLDFDVAEYFAKIQKELGIDFFSKLIIQQTPSGGYHIIYRTTAHVGGSKHLALNSDGKNPIIETRGEGGYFLVYPSKDYTLDQGDFNKMPVISKDQRNKLFDIAKTFCKKPKEEIKKTTPVKNYTKSNSPQSSVSDKVEICIKAIEQKGVDITDGYVNWRGIGFGFVNEFGEGGRNFFHRVSSKNSEYDYTKCDAQYTAYLKAGSGSKTARIDTFFYQCKKHGIEYLPKLRSNAKGNIIKGSEGDGVKIGFTPEEKQQIKEQKRQQEIKLFEKYIDSKKLKYNEVTHHVECNSKNLTDNDINSYYVDLKFDGCTFNKDFVASYIYSDRIEKYNPLTSYLDSLKDIDHKNELSKLLNTLVIKNPQRKRFIKKWLCSIVASAYGETSELVLVLTGDQGNGKTEFFTRLFPSNLQRFFTIDKLDRDKDSDILMTSKLLILDDEFGGKSKKDAQRFKAMASQSVFSVRKPFGRIAEDLKRLAVLCGTSNNTDVINDNTGNRRIIPIELISRDFKASDKVNRNLVFAELVQMFFTEGEAAYKLDKEEMVIIKELSEDYQTVNVEKDLLDVYFSIPENEIEGVFLSAGEIVSYIQNKTSTRMSNVKLGQQMTKAGFIKQQKKINGKPKRGYLVVKNTIIH